MTAGGNLLRTKTVDQIRASKAESYQSDNGKSRAGAAIYDGTGI